MGSDDEIENIMGQRVALDDYIKSMEMSKEKMVEILKSEFLWELVEDECLKNGYKDVEVEKPKEAQEEAQEEAPKDEKKEEDPPWDTGKEEAPKEEAKEEAKEEEAPKEEAKDDLDDDDLLAELDNM